MDAPMKLTAADLHTMLVALDVASEQYTKDAEVCADPLLKAQLTRRAADCTRILVAIGAGVALVAAPASGE